MTYEELYRRISEICPNATMGEDDEGQLIVFTDLKLDEKDQATNLVPLED